MSWQAIQFLRCSEEVKVTHNRLPHWQQEEGCYFLTFRLGDSLPSSLLERFRGERHRWLSFHPEPWDEQTEEEYHRRFSTRIDAWLDAGHGRCILADRENASLVSAAFHYFEGERTIQHAFVIMPNHVHLLCSLAKGMDLGAIVSSWKSHTAKAIRRRLGERGPLWQRDYFDRLIRSREHFLKVARYIRKNRVAVPTAMHYEAPWLQSLLDG
ncbi:transposase [Haloferula sp. A504]|uniref:transposase n=1 Tax=Haloferula sp. A504 TaxID=3373601 RepID=UPI0031C7F3B6|nr:transposase [Verrucomicrobiaceae bacterium E54]